MVRQRERPSSAPPTSRSRPQAAGAVNAAAAAAAAAVVAAAAAAGEEPVLRIEVVPAEPRMLMPSPDLSPEEQFAEKRAIVEKIVEKAARLRIFELSLQIEEEPHHLLQEALLSHEPGLSAEVRELLLCYDNVAAAALHAREAVESLTYEDIMMFQLPHPAMLKPRTSRAADGKRYFRGGDAFAIDVHAKGRRDEYEAADSTPQPSPQQFWSHASLRHI